MHHDKCIAPRKIHCFLPETTCAILCRFRAKSAHGIFHVHNVFYDSFVAPGLRPAPNSVINAYWRRDVPALVVGPQGVARRRRPPEEAQQRAPRPRTPVTSQNLGRKATALRDSIDRAPARAARRGADAARGGTREFGTRWRLRCGARRGRGRQIRRCPRPRNVARLARFLPKRVVSSPCATLAPSLPAPSGRALDGRRLLGSSFARPRIGRAVAQGETF